jgi:hypothetical protein
MVHCIYSFVKDLEWKTDTTENEGSPVLKRGENTDSTCGSIGPTWMEAGRANIHQLFVTADYSNRLSAPSSLTEQRAGEVRTVKRRVMLPMEGASFPIRYAIGVAIRSAQCRNVDYLNFHALT